MTTTITNPNIIEKIRSRFSDRTLVLTGFVLGPLTLVILPYPLARWLVLLRAQVLLDNTGNQPVSYFSSLNDVEYHDYRINSFDWAISYAGAIALGVLAATLVWTLYAIVISPVVTREFTLDRWCKKSAIALTYLGVAVFTTVWIMLIFMMNLPPSY